VCVRVCVCACVCVCIYFCFFRLRALLCCGLCMRMGALNGLSQGRIFSNLSTCTTNKHRHAQQRHAHNRTAFHIHNQTYRAQRMRFNIWCFPLHKASCMLHTFNTPRTPNHLKGRADNTLHCSIWRGPIQSSARQAYNQ